MQQNTVLLDAMAYYDRNRQKYIKFIETISTMREVKYESESEQDKLIFFNKDKKEIATSRFEILGSYSSETEIWTWGWADPSARKKLVSLSRKLLNYGIDISPTPHNYYLKEELITSKFKLNSMVQLDIHIALASYLSKSPLIMWYYDIVIPSLDGITDILVTTPKVGSRYTLYAVVLFDYENIEAWIKENTIR